LVKIFSYNHKIKQNLFINSLKNHIIYQFFIRNIWSSTKQTPHTQKGKLESFKSI